jgi:hypothetical protein
VEEKVSFLDRLAQLLSDPDSHVRKAATAAVGKFVSEGLRLLQKRAGGWKAHSVIEFGR